MFISGLEKRMDITAHAMSYNMSLVQRHETSTHTGTHAQGGTRRETRTHNGCTTLLFDWEGGGSHALVRGLLLLVHELLPFEVLGAVGQLRLECRAVAHGRHGPGAVRRHRLFLISI